MILSYNFILKLIFLLIFFLLTIFLLYQEFIFNEKKYNLLNDDNIIQSSFPIRKYIRELFVVIIPAGIAYQSYFENKNQVKNKMEEIKKEIEKLKTDKEELQENLDKAKTIALEVQRKCSVEFENICDSSSKLEGLNKERMTCEFILDKQKSGVSLTPSELAKLNQIKSIDEQIGIEKAKIGKSRASLEQYKVDFENNDIIKKSGFSLSDFDFQGFISSLSKEELLAFSGLLLNSLILSYTISIILILYGDYLIKRFDLENKYPKLAKFIQIRRQLQNYYLKICFAWIFIGLLPQILVYISILYPKLIELLF